MILSLISTSPLHSELIPSDNLELNKLQNDSIDFTSDDESSLDWEKSSSIEENEENIEENVKVVEKVQEKNDDAPSPVDSETEEPEEILKPEQGRAFDNPNTLADHFYQSLCKKDKRQNSVYVLPWPYVRVTEREVIDKVLLMLLGLSNPFFELNPKTQTFETIKNLEVSHLTPSSLSNYLKFFINLSSLIIKLSLKSEVLLKDECLSFQYLGYASKEILSEFKSTFLSLQSEFSIETGSFTRKSLQKFPSKRITLITLKSSLTQIDEQSHLIQEVFDKLSPSAVLKSSGLLNHLYSLIQFNYSLTDHSSFSIFIRLFLNSLQPFLIDLSNWLTQGTVSKLDPGFMIEKSPEGKSLADAWQLTFKLRSVNDKPVVPVFLQDTQEQILTVGKNMMLIRKIEENILDHVLPPASGLLIALDKLMLSNILHECGHFLNHSYTRESVSVSSVSWNRNLPEAVALEPLNPTRSFELDQDKLESKKLADLMNPTQYSIPEYCQTYNREESLTFAIRSWTSFQHVLHESISKPISQLHSDTCKYILDLLHDRFDLNGYFKAIREVYLLENAENMRPLLKFINKTPDLSEARNNTYELRNCFQECLKTTSHKHLTQYFTCELRSPELHKNSIESIELLRINFAPPTPLDICFDDLSMSLYQKLHTRILQIKRAVYCAKNMKWRSNIELSLQKVRKKHMLFQRKLIHFTSCFEEYVLQDVLHSLANWFLIEKVKVKSIDELRNLHNEYLAKAIERCLLSPKTSPLSGAVNAVFACCVKFYELMKRIGNEEYEGLENKNLFEDLEQNFETANRILLTVLLKSLQNKRQLNCKSYLDLNSYFTLNFNRFYKFD